MVNVGSIGSSVGSILGWGIGLGLLAHTAKNVSRTTDEMYQPVKRGYRNKINRPVRMKSRKTIRTRPSPRMQRTTRMRNNRPRINVPNYWG